MPSEAINGHLGGLETEMVISGMYWQGDVKRREGGSILTRHNRRDCVDGIDGAVGVTKPWGGRKGCRAKMRPNRYWLGIEEGLRTEGRI